MKEQEIIEGNKLIAEFMGAELWTFSNSKTGYSFWDKNGPGRIASFPGGCKNKMPDELKYHLSWDWLMPVVRKITLTNEYWITISNACVEIGRRNEESSFIIYTQTCTPHYISACYYAVVDFIKWYNNQPNQ